MDLLDYGDCESEDQEDLSPVTERLYSEVMAKSLMEKKPNTLTEGSEMQTPAVLFNSITLEMRLPEVPEFSEGEFDFLRASFKCSL